MIYIGNLEERLLKYEAVEKAAETKCELMCPVGLGQWNVDFIGEVGVVLPGLYWVDELRNVYMVSCRVGQSLGRHRLYVEKLISLDGWTSYDLSILNQENRYFHIQKDDSKWEVFATGGMCPKCHYFEIVLRNYCPNCGKRLFKE